MAWSGYFMFGGTELINATRTEAYAKHHNVGWFRPIYNETALDWLLGEPRYTTPLQDDAPWTDPDNLDSYDFYGVYPLEVTGVEDGTTDATVAESVIDGGYIGRVRKKTRTVVFSAVLTGASECAVEYGMRWLRSVLTGGPCFNQAYGSCGGVDLCYLACPPIMGDIEPTYSPGEPAIDSRNLSINPGGEISGIQGWNPNNSSHHVMSVDATAPISNTKSILSTRQAGVIATNMLPSPVDTAAQGATPARFLTYESVVGATSVKVNGTRNGHPVVRTQATGTVWPTQPNLVTQGANGTFEGGVTTGFIGSGAVGSEATVAAEPTIKRSGSHSLKVTWGTGTAGGSAAYVNLTNLVVGQVYTAEAWFYVPAASIAAAPYVGVDGGSNKSARQPVTTPDTWVKSSMTFTATVASEYFYIPITDAASTAGMLCYVDDVKVYVSQNLLTQGNGGTFDGGIVTGWSSAGTAVVAVAGVATPVHAGTGSMRITWAAGAGGTGVVSSVLTGLTIGQQYTAEAWLYIPTGSPTACVSVASTQGSTVTTKDTWVLSTAVFTATAASHSVYVTNVGTATAGQLCYVDDVRVFKSTATTRVGARNYYQQNNPAIPAGTTFVFSTWVYLSPDHPATTGITCICRDDPNGDSAAVTFDPLTPQTKPGAVPLSTWTRYSWRATVNPGRTVTTIYVSANTAFYVPPGAFMDTTEWLIEKDGALDAAYFDGSTPAGGGFTYRWTGTPNASTSEKLGVADPGVTSIYLDNGGQPYPVVAGTPITVGVDVKVEQTNRTVYGYLAWLGGGGVSAQAEIPAGAPGTTVRLVLTGTPPSGTTQAYPVISVDATTGNALTGERVWFDNLSFGADPSGTYFDGSTPASNPYTYAWAGVPHASASVRYRDTWVQDPDPTAEDCYNRIGRSLHEVTTTVGPTVTQKLEMTNGGAAWQVTWTMVAANPAEFGVEKPLIVGFLDPDVDVPYFGGVLPPGGQFDENGNVQSDAPCAVPVFRPVYDPLCGLLAAPPEVPSVVPMCFSFPVNFLRTSFSIPREEIPLWTTVAPIVSLSTKTAEVRSVRVRFYADMFDTGDPSQDPCNYCGDVVFSYIPPGSTIVLDCADREVYIDQPGIGRRRADALITDSKGMPFEWPEFSCGYGYTVTVDMPQQMTQRPILDLSLVPRMA